VSEDDLFAPLCLPPPPTGEMILRDYQREAGNAVMDAFKDHSTALVVMPTGCGKTILFADIIARFQPGRTMVLAHREELIFQAQHKIHAVTGLRARVEMAALRVDEGVASRQAQVIVSTIQTQVSGRDKKRMEKFLPEDFSLVIVDECHHATSKSYRAAIDHYRTNPRLKVLGVTATPDRTDEEALGQIYETVAYDYEIIEAIQDGWLVPVQQQIIQV